MSLRTVRGFWPVIAALLGNAFVTVIKFIVALSSGSSVLLAEAVHSVADTLNQLLLFIGLRQSQKKADDRFEYGYGNERFFWALISACGVLFLGAGVTLYQGVEAILNPEPIAFSWMIAVVLLLSFAVELYTFFVALNEIKQAHPGVSWKDRIAKADSATLAVLLEDSVALFGLFIATVSITLSFLTQNYIFDGIGSVIIALLLGGTAVVLIQRNRAYLLGKSMPDEMREEVIQAIEADPAIEKVLDFKSAVVGLGVYRIKCEVEFNGSALLREANRGSSLTEQFEEVSEDVDEFKKFAADFADRIPRLMGNKIDEIEKRIRKQFPLIRHIDIEIN